MLKVSACTLAPETKLDLWKLTVIVEIMRMHWLASINPVYLKLAENVSSLILQRFVWRCVSLADLRPVLSVCQESGSFCL